MVPTLSLMMPGKAFLDTFEAKIIGEGRRLVAADFQVCHEDIITGQGSLEMALHLNLVVHPIQGLNMEVASVVAFLMVVLVIQALSV